ncbi:MAG: M20/M25/M40 family metallo-hydrolase [Acidobacteriaceae bacterium]|nr:M20/M25/M40 family metallo-hydrolase [Acidobacteriaceae bacterium]
MDEHLLKLMERAILRTTGVARRITSGAGHDAMIMAEKVPSAMMFIRSIGGISHHPDESVYLEDVEEAIRAGALFLSDLAEQGKRTA